MTAAVDAAPQEGEGWAAPPWRGCAGWASCRPLSTSRRCWLRWSGRTSSLGTVGGRPRPPRGRSRRDVRLPGWLALLAIAGGYRDRTLSAGNDQYRLVLTSGVRAIATVAVVNFFLELAVSRLLVVSVFTVTTALTLLGRYAVRRALIHRRQSGASSYAVVAIGARPEVERLTEHLHRARWAGLQVVAACFTDSSTGPLVVEGQRVEDGGAVDGIVDVLAEHGATVLAVTGAGTSTRLVQHLAWQLEGRGVDLLVAPDLADVAGPRIRSEPVAGLPLLFVDEPRLTHPARLVKGVLERMMALALLIVLSPLLAAPARPSR